MAGINRLHLNVVQEPPDTFYNQQGGKYDCFEVTVALRGESSHEAMYMRESLPLQVRLLYENQKVVESQQILQLMQHPVLDLKSRQGTLRVRINEVSKNHQSQRFRLRVSVGSLDLGPDVDPFPTVRDALTSPIRVLSKHHKRRKRRVLQPSVSTDSLATAAPAPAAGAVAGVMAAGAVLPHPAHTEAQAPGVPRASKKRRRSAATAATQSLGRHVVAWTSGAAALLRQLEWLEVGFENRQVGPGEWAIDKARPIHRCPACKGTRFVDSPGLHAQDCKLNYLLEDYTNVQGLQPDLRSAQTASSLCAAASATTPTAPSSWRSLSASAAGAVVRPAVAPPATRAHSVPPPPAPLARKQPSRECLLPLAVTMRSSTVPPARATVPPVHVSMASPLPGSGGRAAPGAGPGHSSPGGTASPAAVVVPPRPRSQSGLSGLSGLPSPPTSDMAAAAGGLWSLGRDTRRSPPAMARQGSMSSQRSRVGARRRHAARAAASGVGNAAPDAGVAGVMAIRVAGYGIPAVAADGTFVGFYHVRNAAASGSSQLAFTHAAQVAMEEAARQELEHSVQQAYGAFRAGSGGRGAGGAAPGQLLMVKSAGGSSYDSLASLRQSMLQSWQMAEDNASGEGGAAAAAGRGRGAARSGGLTTSSGAATPASASQAGAQSRTNGSERDADMTAGGSSDGSDSDSGSSDSDEN